MAIFVERSKNSKISGGYVIASSYASIDATCPDSCKLKTEGCYGKLAYTGIVNSRLNKSVKAKGMTPLEVSKKEARLIKESFGGREIPQEGPNGKGIDLRIHSIGDVSSKKAARALAGAARNYLSRKGGQPYTYTHNWRKIDRSDFGPISVLASLDDNKDIQAAHDKGYAAAIIVPSFPNGDLSFEVEGFKAIACPSQTRDVPCVKCRLCFNADKLHAMKAVIAFEAHGAQKGAIKKRLAVLK